jgi:hypothetical protein
MGVALLLALRFHRKTAWALVALFAIQFPITSTTGRLILCGIYAAVAAAGFIANRGHVRTALGAPFQNNELNRDQDNVHVGDQPGTSAQRPAALVDFECA